MPSPSTKGISLLEAKLTQGEDEVMLALRSGRAIRFNEKTVRPMGRNAAGVRGITLANAKDEVIGMVCLPKERKMRHTGRFRKRIWKTIGY